MLLSGAMHCSTSEVAHDGHDLQTAWRHRVIPAWDGVVDGRVKSLCRRCATPSPGKIYRHPSQSLRLRGTGHRDGPIVQRNDGDLNRLCQRRVTHVSPGGGRGIRSKPRHNGHRLDCLCARIESQPWLLRLATGRHWCLSETTGQRALEIPRLGIGRIWSDFCGH